MMPILWIGLDFQNLYSIRNMEGHVCTHRSDSYKFTYSAHEYSSVSVCLQILKCTWADTELVSVEMLVLYGVMVMFSSTLPSTGADLLISSWQRLHGKGL